MFDNWLAAIKNHTNNLSDAIKAKSRRISNNITSFKNQFSHKSKTTYYTITQKEDSDYYDNDFLSPRAYSMTTFSMDYNAVNENMNWFPYVPPSYDEQNIVDRFIRVITIDDESGMDVSDKTKIIYIIIYLYFNIIFFLQRRTDREEIRRRLAMGSEDDYYTDRPGRKPSLQARLQSGKFKHRNNTIRRLFSNFLKKRLIKKNW